MFLSCSADVNNHFPDVSEMGTFDSRDNSFTQHLTVKNDS